MTGKEIAQYKDKVVDRETLDRLASSENVKTVKDCGIDGNHPGKKWYVIVFNDMTEISVYVK